ncbi:hypothetical protein [Robiginitalea sp.]|uniref:hypothetical protein n=1 Tax=Robiginitalea sp. TaxID=1902411 RepID=UPI003C506B26
MISRNTLPYLIRSRRNILRGLLLGLGFLLTPTPSFSQGKVLESQLYSCIARTFEDGPQVLDSLVSTFEAELLSEGLLENTDGESYRGLLQRIASDQGIVRPPELYFGPRFRSIRRDSIALSDCRNILDINTVDPSNSTLIQFEILRDSLLHENLNPALEALAYLDLLTDGDLALPYYRLFTYELIDRQAFQTSTPDSGFTTYSPLAQLDARGANVFRVYLNERDQLIVSDQLVSRELMLKLVSDHARTFEQSSLYIIEIEPDVKYSQFVSVKDQISLAISEVRDLYSRTILGKTLTELTTSEQAAVFEKYPIRIVMP